LAEHDEPSVELRPALPRDAAAISDLYRRAYGRPAGGDSESPYPFPQFLDPDWVAEAVRQDGLCWVVADAGGELVGTVGALHNVGSHDDAVAEAFGLVVDRRARGHGVAARLFDFLCQCLHGASFIIAEARTAEPGGWRVTRRCGFVPMGFEPYAHFMPVGLEPMLLTGKVSASAAARRRAPRWATDRVRRLARVVLPADAPPPDAAPAHPGYPVEVAPWGQLRRQAAPDVLREFASVPDDQVVDVVRDDRTGRALLGAWPEGDRHASGVVGLRRLVGEDATGRRYDQRCFVARLGAVPVGAVRAVWDRLDRRVRVLELRSRLDGLQGLLMAAVLRDVRGDGDPAGLVIVLDVLADHLPLQSTLEGLGMVPTVYYSCLVGGGAGRADAVQYTWLPGQRLKVSACDVSALTWPEAARVIDEVVAMADTPTGQAPT
jgi:GNAT superfamily N-acetyltransferase